MVYVCPRFQHGAVGIVLFPFFFHDRANRLWHASSFQGNSTETNQKLLCLLRTPDKARERSSNRKCWIEEKVWFPNSNKKCIEQRRTLFFGWLVGWFGWETTGKYHKPQTPEQLLAIHVCPFRMVFVTWKCHKASWNPGRLVIWGVESKWWFRKGFLNYIIWNPFYAMYIYIYIIHIYIFLYTYIYIHICMQFKL